MKTGTIVGIGMAAIFFLTLFGLVFGVIGINNSAVRMEKNITAQYEQNQNSRSAYVNSVAEAAQVPEMYKNDFKEVLTAEMSGRYGDKGSQATFQWLKEHNINFSAELYTKLQTMIEAGRLRFSNEQEMLIEKKRVYETRLETFPGSIVLGFLGFPKIDLASYKIVTSKDNAKVFQEGVEDTIKLRPPVLLPPKAAK